MATPSPTALSENSAQTDVERPRSQRLRWGLVALVGLTGVCLSALVFWLLGAREQELIETQFRLDAARRIGVIQRTFSERLGVVRSLKAFYDGSDRVERGEFRTFTAPWFDEHPGTRWLAWAPRVTESERGAHEQQGRTEGVTQYQIFQRDAAGDLVRAGRREEYFPLFYIEPQPEHQATLGLDALTVPEYAAVLARARQTNVAAAAAICPPGKEGERPTTMLLATPIYRHDTSVPGRPPAAIALEGFVLAAFDIDDVMSSAMQFFSPVGIDICLYDVSEPASARLLYCSASPTRSQPMKVSETPPGDDSGQVQHAQRIPLADRQLEVYCLPTDRYVARRPGLRPLWIFLAGMLLTGLLAGYLGLLAGQAARVERLVAERTAALRESERLLREMLEQQERDRRLVAFEIHDGLAQQLAGASMAMQALGYAADRNQPESRQLFEDALRLVQEAMAEARRLISGLRPPLLEEAGIVAAIEALVADEQRRGGPPIELVNQVRFGRLGPPVERAIYRIVQESLANARRHSRTPKIRVALEQLTDRVRIEVRDWGVGFDPEKVASERFGLRSIRERTRLMGGTAAIETAPGRGTRVVVELPIG